MGVDAVASILGVVLRDKDRHLLPVGCPREILDDPPERQVVVGNEGGPVGIAVLGTLSRRVIVRQIEVGEAGHRPPRLDEPLLEILPELLPAVLIRDVHVVGRIVPRGILEERGRHRIVDREPRPRGLKSRFGLDPPQLEPLAVVAEGQSRPMEVLPDGAGFEVVLGVDGGGGSSEGQPARGFLRRAKIAMPSVGRRQARLDPGVGIDPDQPAVSIRRDVRVEVEVVAEAEALGQREMVRNDVDLACDDLVLRVVDGGTRAIVGQARLPPQATSGGVRGQFAKELVVGPVLLGDHDDVLDLLTADAEIGWHDPCVDRCHRRKVEAVVADHLRRLRHQCPILRDWHQGDDPFLQGSDKGSFRSTCEAGAPIRARAEAFRTCHVEGSSIRADDELRREPRGRQVAKHLPTPGLDDGDCVDTGLGDIEPPLIRAQRHPKGNLTAQPCEDALLGLAHSPPFATQPPQDLLEEVQLDVGDDALGPRVQHRHRVVVGVADKDVAPSGDDAARTARPDDPRPSDRLPNCPSSAGACHEGRRPPLLKAVAPDRGRFRMRRLSQSRDLLPLDRHALDRLTRGESEGREGQPRLFWIGWVVALDE